MEIINLGILIMGLIITGKMFFSKDPADKYFRQPHEHSPKSLYIQRIKDCIKYGHYETAEKLIRVGEYSIDQLPLNHFISLARKERKRGRGNKLWLTGLELALEEIKSQS